MRRRYVAALMGLAMAGSVAVPSVASATTDDTRDQRHCEATFDAAVHEDNDAYNARDAARYEAILNPRMIFWQDGVTTYGRDAIMATARQSFAVPGWEWRYTILSETVYGCDSGIAVAEADVVYPDRVIHFAFTMTLVHEDGKWTVAADSVHRFPS